MFLWQPENALMPVVGSICSERTCRQHCAEHPYFICRYLRLTWPWDLYTPCMAA